MQILIDLDYIMHNVMKKAQCRQFMLILESASAILFGIKYPINDKDDKNDKITGVLITYVYRSRFLLC